ncbi:MAG: sensor histidine kinase [Chryseolinea sp.]
MKIRKALFVSCFAALMLGGLATNTCYAQQKAIDSLQLFIKTTKSDSLRTLAYVELTYNYLIQDTIKSKQNLWLARQILVNHNWDYNWGRLLEIMSQYWHHLGKYDVALLTSDSSIRFYQKAENSVDKNVAKDAAFRKAVVTADKGGSYNMTNRTEEAITAFLEGLHLYEESDNPEADAEIAACCVNIATCYVSIHQFEKAMEYDLKAVPYFLKLGGEEDIAWAYISLASDFTRLEKFDSAVAYFNKAEPYVQKLNKVGVNLEFYGRKGQLYWSRGKWRETIPYYTIAYESAHQIHVLVSEAGYIRAVADCYYNLDDLINAEAFALRSLDIDEKNNFSKEKRMVYNLLSLIYDKKKDYEKAYQYSKNYVTQNRLINEEEQKQLVAELDRKYLKAEQEKEIVQLQKDKEIQQLSLHQRSLMNYVLIGSVIGLILLGTLIYRNFRNRQSLSSQQAELQAQKISELEKDKQLVAVDSILQGQEEERSRMAKDLHDGLGGMLSGVKLSMGAMKGNMILSEYNNTLFNTALEQLDQSIIEMRRVAHSMMPEALVRLGLQQAVQDYCEKLTQAKQFQVKLQSHGLEQRLHETVEIVIYRIVQELVNNAIKHADATIVLVQIMRHNDNLNITIEDNGKGFDHQSVSSFAGQGLKNVQDRVNYLKGQLDIQSIPGKGTSVHIELSLRHEHNKSINS